jgi:aminopeptidase N
VHTTRALILVAALSLAAVAWTPRPDAGRAALPDSSAAWMRRGVSLGLARHRARTIRDVRYDLALDVTALDRAAGRVTVRFVRAGPGDVILDFRGRRLAEARVNGAAFALDTTGTAGPGAVRANGAHIRVPDRALRAGANVLEFAFAADIAPSGASIIRFHDRADGSDYLYTLLVPADANQLFPCFDQPDLKARVTLTLTTPAGWTALANGAVASAETTSVATGDATNLSAPAALAGGRITWRFAESEPISTYLVAFAAGPWHRAGGSVDVPAPGGGTVRRTVYGYVRRSRAGEADLDTLVVQNARALAWMERYFGRPYGFGKFEFLLAPAFPFGGMEHPGAVFYNEDRFIFRERPTLPRRLGRFNTVLHEVAHQWFGDLVTMQWFDDLWLKEGFATYIAAKALDDLDTTSGAWKTFYLGNKPAAYGVDQTAGTTPLWQELANLDQAKSNYGAIVYNKAPSVLKQLNFLVGDPAFRAGIQTLLREHAYANFTWRDLLAAVGRTAHRDLGDFGRQFVLRPGMPEVEQRLTVQGGRVARLALVQRPAQGLSGPGAWPMRAQVLLWYPDRAPAVIPVEMGRPRAAHAGTARASTEVVAARGRPAPAFVFANAGDYGYFLTLLDERSVTALEGGALGRVADPLLRAMLWGALWDQVRAARMAPARYARLVLRELPRERDEQILPSLLGRLGRAVTAYASPAARDSLRPEVERVLWAGAQEASQPYGVRKAYLDAFVGVAATPDAITKLTALLGADSAAGDALRDPTRWDVVTRLRALDVPDAERLAGAQAVRDTTPDGRRRGFTSGAARRSADAKDAYFTRYFADATLNEDWATGSLGAFNALEHQDLTLPFLRPALDSLPFIQANRRIFFLGSWLGAFLGGQSGPSGLDLVRRFLADRPDLPRDLRQKVLQAADELERTVAIRRRWP